MHLSIGYSLLFRHSESKREKAYLWKDSQFHHTSKSKLKHEMHLVVFNNKELLEQIDSCAKYDWWLIWHGSHSLEYISFIYFCFLFILLCFAVVFIFEFRTMAALLMRNILISFDMILKRKLLFAWNKADRYIGLGFITS